MPTCYYEKLFRQYIDVCNKAFAQNRKIFPYDRLLEVISISPPVNVILVDDAPKGVFKITIEDDNICIKNMENAVLTNQVFRMKLSTMEHVVQHPDEYIGDPMKIDWSWVRKMEKDLSKRDERVEKYEAGEDHPVKEDYSSKWDDCCYRETD